MRLLLFHEMLWGTEAVLEFFRAGAGQEGIGLFFLDLGFMWDCLFENNKVDFGFLGRLGKIKGN